MTNLLHHIKILKKIGDYKTHKGQPSLLRSDSMLKAIGKSINIRVSSIEAAKIPIIIIGNSPITESYTHKVDFLKSAGVVQGFISLNSNPTNSEYIKSSSKDGFKTFDNYNELSAFLNMIHELISFRNITVSTCGIVPGIKNLIEWGRPINLAISLHAPNDEIRNRLMPISRKHSLTELMDAVHFYEENAGRRVTFEYIMLEGINDSLECAEELARLIKGTCAYVNLIPFNPVKEKPFKRSSNNRTHAFFDRLNQLGVNTTIRKEFGTDIDAACGQLRAKEIRNE